MVSHQIKGFSVRQRRYCSYLSIKGLYGSRMTVSTTAVLIQDESRLTAVRHKLEEVVTPKKVGISVIGLCGVNERAPMSVDCSEAAS